MFDLTVTIVLCVVCQQLYDRISSKVVSPTRAPPSDAVQKCREVAEVLRELDQNSPELESEIVELEELRDILARPHVRVSKKCLFGAFHLVAILLPGSEPCSL
jgi:hypothetical protein